MTLRLRVDEARWWDEVERVAHHHPGLIPVVKGNGYGFGRVALAARAAALADVIAVGTVHELDGLPPAVTPLVLTPSLAPPPAGVDPILTVGGREHVRALAGWRGRVVVKLASPMRRFGVEREELGELSDLVRRADLDLVAFAVHPPLAGTDDEHLDDIAAWLDVLDPSDPVWVSHLGADAYQALRDAWPDRAFRIRLGTALWHGTKEGLHLDADVLAVNPVRAGTTVGYRQVPVPSDGWVVVIGAGSAHGVAPLADGRSPFHFARHRLSLLEPPHMHTSMVFVAAGEPGPALGAHVDVQRPLITTAADVIDFRR